MDGEGGTCHSSRCYRRSSHLLPRFSPYSVMGAGPRIVLQPLEGKVDIQLRSRRLESDQVSAGGNMSTTIADGEGV